ncbi:hypothetical protein G7054_g1951 [Neopestalotiopsis clavispora]|nr:hypothetical protein G7054_g1951 [Neopestalotiopsis clavispora]
MGLQKTQLNDWVEIDKEYLSRYQYKRELFAKHHAETIQYKPGSFEPSFEALGYLADFLPRRYPTMFRRTVVGIDNLVTGDSWDLRYESKIWETHHPLQIMGLLSTEDWFVLQTDPDQQTTRLTAGANCFPAGWKLQERIGMSMWEIHAGKVPSYEKNLAKSMDRYFVRLRVDSPISRFNYAIDISPELFHISSHHNLTLDGLADPITVDKLYLRVERQVLQRLPKTGALIFSIRTYVTPITEVTKDKERARALRTSVRSYGPELAKYKNKHLWNNALEAHLQEIVPEV